jgi:hypothetical protein
VYEETPIWDQDSITFFFLDGNLKQKNEVKKFAKLWERYTGIKFKYTSIKPSVFNFKKYYKITFKGTSNESTQGAINGIIRLGNLSDDIIFRKTTILHEFGHMLGLGHEHQREDRPLTLSNYKIIDSCVHEQKQSRNWCKENLNDINHSKVFIESLYDPESVMHYDLNSVIDKDSRLLDMLPETQDNSLSFTDKYYIAMLYNQNISDGRLKSMHQQDLQAQKIFEAQANKAKELAMSQLSTSSCKSLKYPTQSLDGKYCETGFMIIGSDNKSFPGEEFSTCYSSLKQMQSQMNQLDYCHLSVTQLNKKRAFWNQQYSNFGQCKILEKGRKNNQEYYCQKGYSFVTKNNDLIGDKTQCFYSKESAYRAMQDNKVCNMNQTDFKIHQRIKEKKLTRQMKTSSCEVVLKQYDRFNCPENYEYTIINFESTEEPVNNQCFASKFQAINAMNKNPFCGS